MKIHFFILVALFFLSPNTQARMYQWVDPDTGTTQMSGKPPIWYRSSEGGPRIFVIENGQVIDDTSINISDEERKFLRQQAFIKVEEDKEEAEKKVMKAEQLKAALDDETQGINEDDPVLDLLDEIEAEADMPEEPVLSDDQQALDDKTAEELRAKITEWETTRTQEAKKLLESDY